MKLVCFQSFKFYLLFVMIFDLKFYTVICYEERKFPVINTMFQCACELSFFFLISDVTYFTVICYEDGKFPVIDTMVSYQIFLVNVHNLFTLEIPFRNSSSAQWSPSGLSPSSFAICVIYK